MDLLSLAELLNELVKVENDYLNGETVSHRTTIGDMYECLTREWISKLEIVNHLNLQIYKNSFVDGCETEYDLILTKKCTPRKLGYTDRYVVSPNDVIALFSITKTLTKDKLFDSIENLKSSNNQFIVNGKLSKEQINMVNGSLKSLYKNREFDNNDEFSMLLETIKLDAQMPLRFIIGYNSFNSEYLLRTNFLKEIKKQLENGKYSGNGPFRYPNLMICGQYCIIKGNGMPYGSALTYGIWKFLMTSPLNPLIFLLEILFTRLSYLFENFPKDVFNDYYEESPIHPLIDITAVKEQGAWGIMPVDLEKTFLDAQTPELRTRQPIEIDECLFAVFKMIENKGHICLDDEQFINYISEFNYSKEQFINHEAIKRFTYFDNNRIYQSTQNLYLFIIPDGRSFAINCPLRYVNKIVEQFK